MTAARPLLAQVTDCLGPVDGPWTVFAKLGAVEIILTSGRPLAPHAIVEVVPRGPPGRAPESIGP